MSEKAYRDHHYVANSDIKSLDATLSGNPMPENLDRIFEFGTLCHQLILEPELADWTDPDIKLALKMKETFMADSFCRSFVEHHNFRAEREFYRNNLQGISAKCKTDGDIRSKKWILEFKSLAVTSQKAFEESILHFNYDQGASWYLDVCKYDRVLIAGVSKKKPEKMFKVIVDRGSDMYLSGLAKYTEGIAKWRELLG